MIIILVSTSIVSAENVLLTGTVTSQSSRQILTRNDIPVLSNTIALSKDTETREILTEIRDVVSLSGSITEQEIRKITEGFGWRPFIGIFYLFTDTGFLFTPGSCIYNLLGFYVGPFIVGTWCGDLYGLFKDRGFTIGIAFLGAGLAIRSQADPGARIFCDFYAFCTLGFYKTN